MALNVRRKYLVDRRLQWTVALRGILYWCFCVASLASLILCWWMVSRPNMLLSGSSTELWMEFGPALLASLLLLPVVVLDAIKISNRIAGPMHRLRKAMHELAEGELVEPLSVRKKDLWKDAVLDFNRVAERLQEAEQALASLRQAESQRQQERTAPAAPKKADKLAEERVQQTEQQLESELEHLLAE